MNRHDTAPGPSPPPVPSWWLPFLVAALALGAAWLLAGGAPDSASQTAAPGQPDFGPNVYVFPPEHAAERIQARVNSIASQQAGNQFGTQRYALLFEPGTYGSAADPLFLQVGYYTSVAGLGLPGRRRHQRRRRFLQPVCAANGHYQQLHCAG